MTSKHAAEPCEVGSLLCVESLPSLLYPPRQVEDLTIVADSFSRDNVSESDDALVGVIEGILPKMENQNFLEFHLLSPKY